MIAAICTIGYCVLCAPMGVLLYLVVHNSTRDKFDREMNSALAGFIGGMVWPLALLVVICFGFARGYLRDGPADNMTRRQRRHLDFERERAAIAERAVKTQREWLRLMEQDEAASR